MIHLLEIDRDLFRNISKSRESMRANKEIKNFRVAKNINFKDDTWDFNYANASNRDRRDYRFDFRSIESDYQEVLKQLIINELMIKKNAIGSAKKVFSTMRTLGKKFVEIGIIHPRLIDVNVLKKIYEGDYKNHKSSYIEKLCVGLKKYMIQLQEIYSVNREDELKYIISIQKEATKMRGIMAKNEYVPDALNNQIVATALKDLYNVNLCKSDRIMGGLVVIMAETGMRVSELTLLETNKVNYVADKGNVYQIPYLEFYTFKITKRKVEKQLTSVFLTDKACEAYKMCCSLVDEIIEGLQEKTKLRLIIRMHEDKSMRGSTSIKKLREEVAKIGKEKVEKIESEMKKYLFLEDRTGKLKRGTELFRHNLIKFFLRNQHFFSLQELNAEEKEGVMKLSFKAESTYKRCFSKELRKQYPYDELCNRRLIYINPHRFRVTVCTKLFKQGVPLDFIVRHMNHLSEDMTTYYYNKRNSREKLEDALRVLANIQNEKGLIDIKESKDSTLNIEAIQDQKSLKKINDINKFLKRGRLVISEDISEILDELSRGEVVIAENSLGICIIDLAEKLCTKRAYFTSLDDNYFIGYIIPSFKYLDLTYEKFKQKAEIVINNEIVANEDNQYMREYEREKKALNYFVINTLDKELSLLDKELASVSKENLLEDYPNLEYVINNKEQIEMELEKWRS
ncbi:MAG: tyrosine-type recombinase/integrase [Cellulosilyticaceae bacterium]